MPSNVIRLSNVAGAAQLRPGVAQSPGIWRATVERDAPAGSTLAGSTLARR